MTQREVDDLQGANTHADTLMETMDLHINRQVLMFCMLSYLWIADMLTQQHAWSACTRSIRRVQAGTSVQQQKNRHKVTQPQAQTIGTWGIFSPLNMQPMLLTCFIMSADVHCYFPPPLTSFLSSLEEHPR